MSSPGRPGITLRPFGLTAEGREVQIYSLTNENGIQVDIATYGGTIIRLLVPDRNGRLGDTVLGYSNLDSYLEGSPYFGALIGRYANRIAGGRFTLEGEEFELARNDENRGLECHLHGGLKGFDRVVWEARPVFRGDASGLELLHTSPDGDEGYPGRLEVCINYWLTVDNVLRIDYRAETDRPTPVNLTQHSYFNLLGEGRGDILDHVLTLRADHYTPVNEGLIPTGEFRPVAGTAFDFTSPCEIGARIDYADEQLRRGGGYDHNFVLRDKDGVFGHAATVYEPVTGREMEVWTTEPGVQFYSGNMLEGQRGKSGRPYHPRAGFCLETQHFPDSPNQERFPSTVLHPNETFQSRTEFRFGAR